MHPFGKTLFFQTVGWAQKGMRPSSTLSSFTWLLSQASLGLHCGLLYLVDNTGYNNDSMWWQYTLFPLLVLQWGSLLAWELNSLPCSSSVISSRSVWGFFVWWLKYCSACFIPQCFNDADAWEWCRSSLHFIQWSFLAVLYYGERVCCLH